MKFIKSIGLGFGLTLGGGLVYALATNEAARLLTIFALGALFFGGTILLTAMLINRQWTRAFGEQRTINNYRIGPPSQSPGYPGVIYPPYQQAPPALPAPGYPPLPWGDGATNNHQNQFSEDDEIIG